MQQLVDITGNKYNYLTVLGFDHIGYIPNGKTRSYWKCKCDCGNIIVLRKDEFIYPYIHIAKQNLVAVGTEKKVV